MDDSVQRRLQQISGHLQKIPSQNSIISSQSCSSNDISEGPLESERQHASFNIRRLTYILDGGKKYTLMKEFMGNLIENDEVMRDDDRFDLSRPQARERTMMKIKYIFEKWSDFNQQQQTKKSNKPVKSQKNPSKQKKNEKKAAGMFWELMSLYDPNWATRIGVHFGLFWPAIQGQGTPEQQQEYEEDVQTGRIFGCFAMTELGHGSYIRGFETTATFDKTTQEFIINSPTDTSTKWWIGMAGQTATHSVVFARLLIDNVDHGVHSFVVPLRDKETGLPLPGVEVGDCGAKMGRNGLDNGWIQYHNVRIPRTNMLMKWSQVSAEGVYTKPPKAQLSYGALIGGRVSMINDSSNWAKKALTIAIRYSAVRRQFPTAKNASEYGVEVEEQILNYQTHQARLMPLLATCLAYHFTGDQITKQFEALTEELDRGDISRLAGVHATSAGLKAFSTWWCNEALEICRQCLGGHGYSSYAGISSLLADFAVMCTWEGDNTVLAQQTSKFLMKTIRNSLAGKPVNGFEQYLSEGKAILSEPKWQVNTVEECTDSARQLEALRHAAVYIIANTAKRMQVEAEKHKSKQIVWNECMVDLVLCARVHCDYFTLSCFINALKEITDEPIKVVLKKLCDLHALVTIERYFGYLLADGFMSGQQTSLIRDQIRQLCKEIRKEAVPIVDSFNFPDWLLNSPLGSKDGEVYKHYLERVKKAPNALGKAPYWDTLIKPLTTKPKLQHQ